jgi:hypothetical protein
MVARGSRMTTLSGLAGALVLASGCASSGVDPATSIPATGAQPVLATAPVSAQRADRSPAASGAGPWQAGRYAVAGDLSSVVDLLPDGTAYLTAQPFITTRDRYRIDGGIVTLSGESCDGTTGTYRWSTDGTRLRLALVDDACADRSALLGLPLDYLREQLPYLVMQASRLLAQPDYNQSAVDGAGHFYTTDGGSDVFEYQADGTPVRRWHDGLTYTTGVTVDTDGSVYVANFDDATVHQFSAAGRPVRSWKVDDGTVGPVGLAHDATGNVYVALHRLHDHYVEKYSPAGKLLGGWAPMGSGDGQVGAGNQAGASVIAVTRDGTSYLGDPVNNRLVRFAPDGTFVANLTGDGTHRLASPTFVAVDGSGDVFTLSLRTLWEFSDTGKVLGRWFSPYDGNIVVDDGGSVWLVDRQIIAVRLPG